MELSINIDVPDLDRAVRFYADGLGLRRSRLLFDGTVAEMQGGPAPIYLLYRPDASGGVPGGMQKRHYDRHWTPVHLDFIVADMAAAIEQVLQAGAKVEQPPAAFAWGTLATCSDPFGHGFCLIEWRGRGYDEVQSS